MGWEKNCGGPGRLTRVPGSFQPVASSLKLGTTQGCLKALKEHSLSFLQLPATLLVFKPAKESSQCWIPGLGCPVWGWNPSFPREDPWADDIPFIFWVTRHGCGSWIDFTSSPPTWSQFFLYNLHHKRAVLILLRWSAEIADFYVVVVLMCSMMGGEFKVFLLSHLVPTPAFTAACAFNH